MRKPKRPEHVDIGPHRFTISWDSESLNDERVKDKAVDCPGFIRYASNAITIDGSADESFQREVLFHELFHGVLAMTGGNKFPKKATVDDILARIDAMLLDTLQRNPHVTAWLTDRGPRA